MVIDRTINPPSCIPEAVDRDSLIDITCVGDSWRKYIDQRTGEVHDGEKYWQLTKGSDNAAR